ncbi:hypothetical protein MCEMIEM13_01490 [Comamonadaceae bacterium]
MTLTEKIIKACSSTKGMCRAELAKELGHPANNLINLADFLVKEKRLHKAGVLRAYRYFAAKADADAWDLVAKDAYAAQLQATRDARNEQRRTGNPPGRPASMQAAHTAAIKHQPVLRNYAAPKPAPKPINIIQPDSVKVQVIPTPPSRFHFEPPPGWVGHFRREWMDRRLARSGG